MDFEKFTIGDGDVCWNHNFNGITEKAIETIRDLSSDDNVVILCSSEKSVGGLVRTNSNCDMCQVVRDNT